MNNQVQNELLHYGVLGMHWGQTKGSAKAWVKEARIMSKNSLRHPNLTDRADKASKNASSFKDQIRRELVYQNLNEIKDVNARTAKMITDHAAAKKKTQAMIKSAWGERAFGPG